MARGFAGANFSTIFTCTVISTILTATRILTYGTDSSKICECLIHGALDSECVENFQNLFEDSNSTSLPRCYNKIFQKITVDKWLSVHQNDFALNCTDSTVNSLVFPTESLSDTSYDEEIKTFLLKPISFPDCKNVPLLYKRSDLFIDTKIFKHLQKFRRSQNENFHFDLFLKLDTSPLQNSYHCSIERFENCNDLGMSIYFDFITHNLQVNYTFREPYSKADGTTNTSFLAENKALALESNFQKLDSEGLFATIFIPRTLSSPVEFFGYPRNFLNHIGETRISPFFLKRHKYADQPLPMKPKMLILTSKRLFGASMLQFTLEWGEPKVWYGKPDSYQLKCKVFNGGGTKYHSKACKMCHQNSNECSSCMQEAYTIPDVHPLLTAKVHWSQLRHTFSIRTNLTQYTDMNGALHWNPSPGITNDVNDILTFDWYRANLTQHQRYVQHSVVIPGPYAKVASIPDPIQRYFALCSVQGILRDETAGLWSSVLQVPFDGKNMQRMQLLALTTRKKAIFLQQEVSTGRFTSCELENDKPNLKFVANSQSGAISIGDSYSSNRKVLSPNQFQPAVVQSLDGALTIGGSGNNERKLFSKNEFEPAGCYHFMFNCWYVFLEENQQLCLGMYCSSTDGLRFDEIAWKKVMAVPTDIIPKEIKCPELHPYLTWSATTSSSAEVSMFRLQLHSITGEPVPPYRNLQENQLCQCTNGGRIQSPHFDLVYQDLDTADEPRLVLVCEKTVCLHGDRINKQLAQLPTKATTEINGLAMDLNNLYILCCTTENYETIQPQVQRQPKKMLYHLRATTVPLDNITGIKYIDKSELLSKTRVNGVTTTRYHKLNQLMVFKEASSFPIPPAHCIFPKVTAHTIKLSMVSEYSIRIQAQMKWNMAKECEVLAKPSAILQLNYVLKDNKTETYSCFINQHRCQSAKDSPSRLLNREFEFGPLIPNRDYYFEVSVLPALNESLWKSWYSGTTVEKLKKTFRTKYVPPAKTVPPVFLIGITVFVAVLITLLLAVLIWMYKRKYYLYQSLKRLSVKEIERQEKLGEGHYGEVWKALLNGKREIVVKLLKESATDLEEKEFREEALLMSKLQCDCIISPIGVCLQSRPIMLALEFMDGGSVDKYLRREDVQNTLDMHDLFLVIEHAVSGCLYLQTEGYIHRDLSARNLLVQLVSSKNLKPKRVKLSDFGLAKDTGSNIYHSRSPEKDILPVAWSAPETFKGYFSTKSDVWAFGVLIWEVFSWASMPYSSCSMKHMCPLPAMSHMDVENFVCKQMKNLLHLEKPCNALFSSSLEHIMEWCWAYDPDERPFFSQLVKFLLKSRQSICEKPIQNQTITPAVKIDIEYVQDLEGSHQILSEVLPTQLLPAYYAGTEVGANQPAASYKTRPVCNSSSNDVPAEIDVASLKLFSAYKADTSLNQTGIVPPVENISLREAY